MNLKLYTAPGTPFPVISKYAKSREEKYLPLLDDFRLVEKELYKQLKVRDVILLSIRMPYYFGGTYYENTPSAESQENYFNEWITSVENLANIAYKQGAKVIIQTPIPEWEKEYKSPNVCRDRQWFNILSKINCQIKSKFFIDEETGLYKHLFGKLNQLSRSHENIYLFDIYKIVCPESTCNFTRDGVDIYRDEDHITYEWARDFLSPEIYKFITDIQNMD